MCLGWLAANRERILEEEVEKRKVEHNRTNEQKNKRNNRTNEQTNKRTTEQAKITAESFLNWRKKIRIWKKKIRPTKTFSCSDYFITFQLTGIICNFLCLISRCRT